MTGIYGILGLAATDRSYVATIGQRVVYDAAVQYLAMINADMDAALSFFIEEITEDFKERYKLPGGGRMQRRGGLAQSAAVRSYGKWDVAYPLEDFGDQVAGDDVAMAYMRIDEFNRHLETIRIRNINTVRFEILRAIFVNTTRTFEDPLDHIGSLTLQPLANGDAIVYPPVLGSESEATENHYIETGYLASAISDTNNPFVTGRDELTEHFGLNSGGEDIAVFYNGTHSAKVEALSDFDEVSDRFVEPGANLNTVMGLPEGTPGVVRGRVSGTWAVEWPFMPANYMYAQHLRAPAPLKMRVDPADTNLPRGLALVSEDDEYPIERSHWRHRFGVAVGNRLNGVVLELGNGGTYTIPTAYA